MRKALDAANWRGGAEGRNWEEGERLRGEWCTYDLRKIKVVSCGFVWDTVSLCSLGCSTTHTVDQDDLKLIDLPTSAFN